MAAKTILSRRRVKDIDITWKETADSPLLILQASKQLPDVCLKTVCYKDKEYRQPTHVESKLGELAAPTM